MKPLANELITQRRFGYTVLLDCISPIFNKTLYLKRWQCSILFQSRIPVSNLIELKNETYQL